MEDVVSIVIPAFNQLDYCVQCIESVRANTEHPYRLVLVDNASTDGVGDYFDSVPGACVVHAPENKGFPGGVNLGLAHAEGHVLLLNSDTLVSKGWLTRLVSALRQQDDIGMVGPMSNFVTGEQLIFDTILMRPNAFPRFADDLAVRNRGRIKDVVRLVGFCLLIRDTVLQSVGPLDESFGIGNFEDDDYCIRVLNAGYRLAIAEDCFVFHYGNRTFEAMGFSIERLNVLLEHNRQKLLAKWKGLVEQPEDVRNDPARSQQLHDEAMAALKRHDALEAVRLLYEAIQACVRCETNYNDLGVILWEMGERERAINCFRQALQLNPSYEEARQNLRETAAKE